MINRKISIGNNTISFSIEEASDKIIQGIVDSVSHEDLAAGMFAMIDNTFSNLGICGNKIFQLDIDEELKSKIFNMIAKSALTNLAAVYPIAAYIDKNKLVKLVARYCFYNNVDMNDRNIFADLQKELIDDLDEFKNKKKEKTNE